ncbi:hypothetical protein ACFRCW_44530 [Streptomyces sp. NPDC056653]|uniref:hypothetical protein n=1 Tax=Streptomyces sp. NPDC056653 TaxID=3345894 RepID=UPI0036BDA450
MTVFPLEHETDATRRAILAAMNRLFAGTHHWSTGRLNVSQLAIEARVKRWSLTHQHTDLKDLLQQHVAKDEANRVTQARSTDAYEELKTKQTDLQAHCRFLEERLKAYAAALNLLSLEHAAVTGRDAEAAKVHTLPGRRQHTR